jgi:hypothetical protein
MKFALSRLTIRDQEQAVMKFAISFVLKQYEVSLQIVILSHYDYRNSY